MEEWAKILCAAGTAASVDIPDIVRKVPSDTSIALRLNSAVVRKMDRLCASYGMSRSDFVRGAIYGEIENLELLLLKMRAQ